MAHTSLIEQSQSKKFASADMEMSFNILEILSYFHLFYSQLLFKQSKKTHQISVSVNLKKPIKLAYQSNFFHFFLKRGRPVTLRVRLTRKFCLQLFITLIYSYSFQF